MKRLRTREQFLELVNSSASVAELKEKLGEGYEELQLASEIVTLARKGVINKVRAVGMLRKFPQMLKFLDIKIGAKKGATSKY